jgi:uncharacterized protein YcfL
MNLRKQHLLIILALLLLNLGCESTESEDQAGEEIEEQNSEVPFSKLLSSVTTTQDDIEVSKTTFKYNDNYQRIEKTTSIYNPYGDNYTETIFYFYDDMGNITETRDSKGWIILHFYSNGQIYKTKTITPALPSGAEIYYDYNSDGYLLEGRSEFGGRTTYVYGEFEESNSNVSNIAIYNSDDNRINEELDYRYDQMKNPLKNGLPLNYYKLDRLSDSNVNYRFTDTGSSYTNFYDYFTFEYDDESYPISRIRQRDRPKQLPPYTLQSTFQYSIYEYIDL